MQVPWRSKTNTGEQREVAVRSGRAFEGSQMSLDLHNAAQISIISHEVKERDGRSKQ